MSRYQVLVVGLPAVLEKHPQSEIHAEAADAVTDALAMLPAKRYDAAVCWADRHDDLAAVIRIRKARPDLPIMVLTSRTEPQFAELARKAGATRATPSSGELAAISEQVRLAISSGDLAREQRTLPQWVHSQAREIRILAKQMHVLAGKARSNLPAPRLTTFSPTIVEDDPDQAHLLVRAFKSANLAGSFPVFRSGEDLIDHLSGSSTDFVSGKRPCPSVVILDLHLPGKSGLEVLEWIRHHPQLSRLPVVILSGSTDGAKIDRAYELGAQAYLVKPSSYTALVALAKGLISAWGDGPP